MNSTGRRDIVNSETDTMVAGYQGDFESEISRHSPVLFRVALQRLHNVEDAEDAVQESLLSAYKCLGQFQGRSQFSTWLTRIVINTALMKLRKRSRYPLVSLEHSVEDDAAAPVEEFVDTRPNPEVTCAQTEMEEKLDEALSAISPKLRIAFQMRELAGMSTRDTANALGITVNTLKSRMLRARAALSLRLGRAASRRSESESDSSDLN
jgi:RNA polymerase sigma-70 factor (ECF subfamily)